MEYFAIPTNKIYEELFTCRTELDRPAGAGNGLFQLSGACHWSWITLL